MLRRKLSTLTASGGRPILWSNQGFTLGHSSFCCAGSRVLAISESFPTLGVALPRAATVLKDIGGISVFHDEYGFRHPFGAYNLSLAAIGMRICRLVEAINSQLADHATTGKPGSGEAILESTDHLLDAAMEHLDVCHSIVSSFVNPADAPRRKAAFSQLKREIEPYRRHIGLVDNYIKHNQGRLRLVEFTWPGHRCLGYFVEGPISSGVIGPAREIHSDANSAYSFNRDIRYHLCSIFAVGARLANVLYSIDKRLVGSPIREVATRDSDWMKAIRLTADLPQTFFPDEVAKPIPEIRVSNDRVVVSAPSARAKATAPPNGATIAAAYSGDGVTRSFKLPYYGRI